MLKYVAYLRSHYNKILPYLKRDCGFLPSYMQQGFVFMLQLHSCFRFTFHIVYGMCFMSLCLDDYEDQNRHPIKIFT